MNQEASTILHRALAMQESDRAFVARELLSSLDGKDNEDVEKIWKQEIRNRIKEIDLGKIDMMPFEEVKKHMQEKFGSN